MYYYVYTLTILRGASGEGVGRPGGFPRSHPGRNYNDTEIDKRFIYYVIMVSIDCAFFK